MAPGAEPGRIVIVDDDAAHTQALCDTLQGQGMKWLALLQALWPTDRNSRCGTAKYH